MICVDIDVAKGKYDCFILIPNNAESFDNLLQTIRRCARPADKIRVGLEAKTGMRKYSLISVFSFC